MICSVICWGSVAGRNSRDHGPEADVVASVPKPPSSHPEADFTPVSLKRVHSSAVEHLFQGHLPGGCASESWKTQSRPLPGRPESFPTALYPSCRVNAGVGQAEEHVCPCAVDSPGPPAQSSEHAKRDRASLRSSRVLRRWHELQSQCRFSIVKARLSACVPNARATLIASLWSGSTATAVG